LIKTRSTSASIQSSLHHTNNYLWWPNWWIILGKLKGENFICWSWKSRCNRSL